MVTAPSRNCSRLDNSGLANAARRASRPNAGPWPQRPAQRRPNATRPRSPDVRPARCSPAARTWRWREAPCASAGPADFRRNRPAPDWGGAPTMELAIEFDGLERRFLVLLLARQQPVQFQRQRFAHVNGAPHAKVLTSPRACMIASTSSSVIGGTKAPFFGTIRRNPSASSRSSASRTGVRDMPVARHTSASVRKVPSVRGSETTCCFSQAKTTSCAASGLARLLRAGVELIIGKMYTSCRYVGKRPASVFDRPRSTL